MKIFKIKTGPCKSYDISRENFEQVTNRDKKYVLHSGDITRYYAVCPACDNPIMLLGMYEPMSDGRKNIGVHQKNDVKGIANYDRPRYVRCPLRSKNAGSLRKEFHRVPTTVDLDIYNTVRQQYDKVVFMIEDILGMKISRTLAKSFLEYYRDSGGYRYDYATMYNIPWVIPYMHPAFTLYKRRILPDSPLYSILKDTDGITLTEVKDKEDNVIGYIIEPDRKTYIQLTVILHKTCYENDTSYESMTARVIKEKVKKTSSGYYERTGEWDKIGEYLLDINQKRFPALIAEYGSEIWNSNMQELAKAELPEI